MKLFHNKSKNIVNPVFQLSEEDLIKGNYRINEGLSAGKVPITLDAGELIVIQSKVLGLLKARDNLVTTAINKGYGKFTEPSSIPVGYVKFGDIHRQEKVFIMDDKVASGLNDISLEMSELGQEDYFTNQIYK